jgi:MobA/MobL family
MGERVSRGGGGSSVRAAAYLSRECFEDQRTGWRHDFTKPPIREASDHIIRAGHHAEGSRQEVLFSGLYAPEGAPDWCKGAANIERFWNRAEAAERRSDAQIAERVIIALPHEMTVEQARWAVQDHVREFTREGRVVQVAIHSPEPGHDERNLHAHLLISTRGVDENGLKATKAVEQKERFMNRSAYVEHLRENWARVANRHLERHGQTAGLDHRSYQRQGLNRESTLHMGPGDADRERRGQRTEVGDHNRGVRARNAARGFEPEPPTPAAPAQRLESIREERARAFWQAQIRAGETHVEQGERVGEAATLAAIRDAAVRGGARLPVNLDIGTAPGERTEHSERWDDITHLMRSASADRDGRGNPKTVEQIARVLDPAFAKADDSRKALFREAGEDRDERQRRANERDQAAQDGELRREQIGRVRGLLHDTHVWPDQALKAYEKRGQAAEKAIEKIGKRQHKRHPKIEAAVRNYDQALARVTPAAQKQLAELQQIGGQARERLEQVRAVEREKREQERQSERQGQRRGYGMSL